MAKRPFTKYNMFYAETATRIQKEKPDTKKLNELINKLSKELNKFIKEYGQLEVDAALVHLIVYKVKDLPKETRARLILDVIENLATENNDIIERRVGTIPKPDNKEVT